MNIIGVLIVPSNQYIINGVSPNSLLEIERTIVADQDNHYCNQSETAIMQIPIIKWPKDSKKYGFLCNRECNFPPFRDISWFAASFSFICACGSSAKKEKGREIKRTFRFLTPEQVALIDIKFYFPLWKRKRFFFI